MEASLAPPRTVKSSPPTTTRRPSMRPVPITKLAGRMEASVSPSYFATPARAPVSWNESQSSKPAKGVRPGDYIKVTLPQGRRRVLKVVGLDERRGAPAHARLLYDDLTPPEPPRPRWSPPPFRPPGAGRPTKRERRALDRLREL